VSSVFGHLSSDPKKEERSYGKVSIVWNHISLHFQRIQRLPGLYPAVTARFIASLDPNIPKSLPAFHPQFYMSDLPMTSRVLANRCCRAARDAGLNKVRIGNVHLLT
jgi:hypothetical protein